jgi:hypothetical protein
MKRGDEKARRMQLQRDLGVRVPKPRAPVAAHPGVRRIAHACFACRRSAKLTEKPDLAPHVCPTCRGPLHWMGWSFHVPAHDDVEQWDKVRILYARGFRFVSSGFSQYPPLPARLRDVDEFLLKHPDHPLRIAEPRPISDPESR